MALFTRAPAPAARPAPPQARPLPTPPTLGTGPDTLVFAGPGRAPGVQVYADLGTGRTLDLYHARVTHAVPGYLLAELPGHPSVKAVRLRLADVRLAGSPVQTGDGLLVGPLRYDADGVPRAERGWRVAAAPAPRPDGRGRGAVNRIHHTGAFGEVTDERGKKLFFHVSELPPGFRVAVGTAVTFREVLTGRGWSAEAVRPA